MRRKTSQKRLKENKKTAQDQTQSGRKLFYNIISYSYNFAVLQHAWVQSQRTTTCNTGQAFSPLTYRLAKHPPITHASTKPVCVTSIGPRECFMAWLSVVSEPNYHTRTCTRTVAAGNSSQQSKTIRTTDHTVIPTEETSQRHTAYAKEGVARIDVFNAH